MIVHHIWAVVSIIAATVTRASEHITEYASFDEFKNAVNRSYMHAFDEFRSREAFEQNANVVRQHNKLFEKGESSYRLRTNIMADMNNDYYLKGFLRLLKSKRFGAGVDLDSEIVGSPLMQLTPEAIDWRTKGFNTQPDNQKTCGSCYAFSIAESIEGQVFKRTRRVLHLSPQQIVDCSVSHGNQGCTGGSLRNTLKYLQETGGIMREQDYRYVSKKGVCQFAPELAVVNVTSWAILPAKDEKAIEAAVAHIGPVPVSINATPRTFQLYSDGIYDDDSCSSDTVNHAMLVVGYTKDYWILKNWWGEMWGEDGYMRLRKGKNLCGIANYAAYSII
ncbi:PREDICTED: cathepsin L1 [Rhagoletis zephyria]|uniref:cathepsin L1 n=1 Tax=Rhagoletis zephyria TaxID=28612 RepID=UPI00081167C4|nr:PREDICTED: cathepsin L1 [Rhagoletis zephyria]XP_036335274.1 cathepsin L1 [Rhagoletis pomonella]